VLKWDLADFTGESGAPGFSKEDDQATAFLLVKAEELLLMTGGFLVVTR
jgi:hypothetical protein